MEASLIAKIKEYQRNFQNEFGTKLEIDWPSMLGSGKKGRNKIERPEVNLEEILVECAKTYSADIDVIKNRKIRVTRKGVWTKESSAIGDFCKEALKRGVAAEQISKHLNRNRTFVYYFKRRYGNEM
jgi:hypothetical protein